VLHRNLDEILTLHIITRQLPCVPLSIEFPYGENGVKASMSIEYEKYEGHGKAVSQRGDAM
jgi:hypothetical protein